MRPLRISATFCSPLAGDAPMLDALLEWCMSRHVCRSRRLGHADPQRAEYAPGTIPTPLLRRAVAGFAWPVPLASAPIFTEASDGVEHVCRRFEADPALIAPGQRRVFYVSNGEFKAYRLPLRVRLVERVVWFAAVADGVGVKEVRRLLRGVAHLGKKTSDGFGQVREWTVEGADADYSWLAPSPAGPVLMRPLPASADLPEGVQGSRRWFGGVVPPYWCSRFFAEAVTPC